MPAITVDSLTKSYGQGDTLALEDLSFQVREGEVFGFLGPNGAGKSTTINVLLDFIRPTAGRVEVLGMDAQVNSREIRARTGVLPEGVETYDRLTARQHLEFAIESKGAADDPEVLLERVGLADAIDKKAGGYSKGMSQRLMLAMALVGEPDLLILDEPSTGLDPNGAREMRDIVREENARGATVFFSSHIMEQVEAVCDRVGILRDGEMVAVDSVEGLRDSIGGGTSLRVTVDRLDDDALQAVRSLPDVSNVAVEGVTSTASRADGDSAERSSADRSSGRRPREEAVSGEEPTTITIQVQANGSKTAVLGELEDHGVDVQDFSTREASLEDVFRSYTTESEVEAR